MVILSQKSMEYDLFKNSIGKIKIDPLLNVLEIACVRIVFQDPGQGWDLFFVPYNTLNFYSFRDIIRFKVFMLFNFI